MTTRQYIPFILNRRDLFLHELRDVNFSLYRVFQDKNEVKVLEPSKIKEGTMTLTLEESRFLWWKSESYVLKFEGTKVPLSKAKHYLPKISTDDVFYYVVQPSAYTRSLESSERRQWYDMSTENETKYVNEYGTHVTKIWKIKENTEWPYIYDDKIFKSKRFECNGSDEVFIPNFGMISRNNENLGIAISNEKISILAEFKGDLCHFSGYQWKFGDKIYLDYADSLGKIKLTEIPKVMIDVKRPDIGRDYFDFVSVKGRNVQFISMNQILISEVKIWETLLDMKVREIEEGYRQVRVCQESDFVSGQQVYSQKFGRAVVASVLMNLNERFSGKILIKIERTCLVVNEGDLSFLH